MTSNDENEVPSSPPSAPRFDDSNTPLIKTRLNAFRLSATSSFKNVFKDSFKNVQLLSWIEWANKALQKRGASFFGKLLTILLCTFFLSDLATIFVGKLIPEPPYVPPVSMSVAHQSKTLDDYNVIFTRNLFSSKGIIPGDEIPLSGSKDLGGPPVKTSLPFNLIGTMILSDESRSLATIEDTSAKTSYPVRVDDEIPSKAKIIHIESRKVIFVNTATGRREYVELPDDTKSLNPKIMLGGPYRSSQKSANNGIEQVSPNNFNISRSEIDQALSNMNSIITEARLLPNNENGAMNGYKIIQIVPGSIYQKLGFQNGDVITQLNGKVVNDPFKAMEELKSLKEQKHYEISGKRDGRPFTYSYDFQ